MRELRGRGDVSPGSTSEQVLCEMCLVWLEDSLKRLINEKKTLKGVEKKKMTKSMTKVIGIAAVLMLLCVACVGAASANTVSFTFSSNVGGDNVWVDDIYCEVTDPIVITYTNKVEVKFDSYNNILTVRCDNDVENERIFYVFNIYCGDIYEGECLVSVATNSGEFKRVGDTGVFKKVGNDFVTLNVEDRATVKVKAEKKLQLSSGFDDLKAEVLAFLENSDFIKDLIDSLTKIYPGVKEDVQALFSKIEAIKSMQ